MTTPEAFTWLALDAVILLVLGWLAVEWARGLRAERKEEKK